MASRTRGTIIRPPPDDPSKSLIENVLELTPLSVLGPDVFSNTRPLWQPPGARGIYGGNAIAQSLGAAQLTIPEPSKANGHAVYLPHSMHCYFVLAGESSLPVIYHVERVRDGKSFITRTVQARQNGRCIFTTTISFMRESDSDLDTVDHEAPIPPGVLEELAEEFKKQRALTAESKMLEAANGNDTEGPFETVRLSIHDSGNDRPEKKRTRQFLRIRGNIARPGHQNHLTALAYMSDNWFIGTVVRVQNLWRFSNPKAAASRNKMKPSGTASTSSDSSNSNNAVPKHAIELAALEERENTAAAEQAKQKHSTDKKDRDTTRERRVGMMVSLDHTIYFHRPRDVKVDEGLITEMESPWAGDERGFVIQRMWNMKGQLVATCIQEGLIRLVQKGTQDLKGKPSKL